MLTNEQIDLAYREVWSTISHAHRLIVFAHLIEAKVRKQIEAAVLAEREACAKVCDGRYMGDCNREDLEARRCADAIRSRAQPMRTNNAHESPT